MGTRKLCFKELWQIRLNNGASPPAFTITPQTVSALTTTLCTHAMFIEDLLNEAYQSVITARLQRDPVEDVFPSAEE